MQPRTVTETIKHAIKTSEQTRYRIAANTGIDKATLSRFMAGKGIISGPAIDTLATYFKLELKPTITPANEPAATPAMAGKRTAAKKAKAKP